MTNPDALGAIFDRLAGLEALVDELAEYSDLPAIFTGARVPGDAPYPYVHVQPVAGVNDDTKTSRRPELFFDVGVYADDPETSVTVERLAWAIHEEFHRRPLALGAFQNVVAEASPPIVAPTSDEITGRIISLRLVLSSV